MIRLLSMVVALVLLITVAPVSAAELELRESFLQSQADKVITTITATVAHIGKNAHSLSEDCDLHVPLRSRDLEIPILAEMKNACSMKPAGEPNSYWSQKIYDETFGKAVSVSGVLRIWLEHPPSGAVAQVEGERVQPYVNSNPDHQVELHPLTQVGALDLRDHIKWIELNGQRYEGYGPDKLITVLNKTITVQRTTHDGVSYVRLHGPKTGFNHWALSARVVGTPTTLSERLLLRLDVLNGNSVVPGAISVPAVVVAGTEAFTKAQSLGNGNIIDFLALGRIYVPEVLSHVNSTPQDILLPLEFVLLDLEQH